MKILKQCYNCKKNKLWFQLQYREFKPNSFMPKIRSNDKMCGECFNKLKKNFIK